MTGTYLTLKNLLRQFVREKKWDEWANLLPYYSDQCEEEGDWKEMYAARGKWIVNKTPRTAHFAEVEGGIDELNKAMTKVSVAFPYNSEEFLGIPAQRMRLSHSGKPLTFRTIELDDYRDSELDTVNHPLGYYACFIPKELGGLL